MKINNRLYFETDRKQIQVQWRGDRNCLEIYQAREYDFAEINIDLQFLEELHSFIGHLINKK